VTAYTIRDSITSSKAHSVCGSRVGPPFGYL